MHPRARAASPPLSPREGREIRLAGIEPADADKTKGVAVLAAVIAGRDVTLHGADDTPDRYGRQTAFVFVAGSEAPVQNELLRQGAVLFSANVADTACAGTSPRPRPRPYQPK